MELNVKKAFLSPFSQDKWYIKLIFPSIMAVFSLVSNAIMDEQKLVASIIILLTIIPSLILNGFFAQFGHNEIHDLSPLLPDLKSRVKEYLKRGFQIFALVFIYSLIFVVLGFIVGFVAGFTSAAMHFDKTIFSTVFVGLLTVAAIILFTFLVLTQGAYADNFEFKAGLNYKRIFALVNKVKFELFIYILLSAGMILALALSMGVLAILKFTLILLPVLVTFEQLISTNLKAQIYKIAKSREQVIIN